jgi:hypothetical protein
MLEMFGMAYLGINPTMSSSGFGADLRVEIVADRRFCEQAELVEQAKLLNMSFAYPGAIGSPPCMSEGVIGWLAVLIVYTHPTKGCKRDYHMLFN